MANPRKLAPHVQAAIAATLQKKPGETPSNTPPRPAPHVEAALRGVAQPMPAAERPGASSLAPHVQAALGKTASPAVQPKSTGAPRPDTLQRASTYNMRDRTPAVPAGGHPPPEGFKAYSSKMPHIFYRQFQQGKLLWWSNATHQIDKFAYTGNRDEDIEDCYAKYPATRDMSGTWHHTGVTTDGDIEESYGVMQFVHYGEHDGIGHIGGTMISQGKFTGN